MNDFDDPGGRNSALGKQSAQAASLGQFEDQVRWVRVEGVSPSAYDVWVFEV